MAASLSRPCGSRVLRSSRMRVACACVTYLSVLRSSVTSTLNREELNKVRFNILSQFKWKYWLKNQSTSLSGSCKYIAGYLYFYLYLYFFKIQSWIPLKGWIFLLHKDEKTWSTYFWCRPYTYPTIEVLAITEGKFRRTGNASLILLIGYFLEAKERVFSTSKILPVVACIIQLCIQEPEFTFIHYLTGQPAEQSQSISKEAAGRGFESCVWEVF